MEIVASAVGGVLSTRTLLYSNLALLGFSKCLTGSFAHLEFNEEMFNSGANTIKSMEIVTWFLLQKLDPRNAEERFISCWPPLDVAQAREYRNIVFKWIEQLKKDGFLPANLIVRRSFFDECRGDRFERILLALSTHVIQVVIARDYKQYIKLPSVAKEDPSKPDIKDKLQICIWEQSQNFLKQTQQRHKAREGWKRTAAKLTSTYDSISETKTQLTTKRAIFNDGLDVVNKFESMSLNDVEEYREQQLERIRTQWKRCLHWLDTHREHSETISSILNNTANKYRLDGSSIKLAVPDELMIRWESAFVKDGITPYCENKLELVSAFRIGKLAVTMVKEETRQREAAEKFNTIAPSLSSLRECHKEHTSQYFKISALRQALISRIEALKHAQQHARKSQSNVHNPNTLGESHIRKMKLCSPSSPLSLDLDGYEKGSLSLTHIIKNKSPQVKTPKLVTEIRRSVHQTVINSRASPIRTSIDLESIRVLKSAPAEEIITNHHKKVDNAKKLNVLTSKAPAGNRGLKSIPSTGTGLTKRRNTAQPLKPKQPVGSNVKDEVLPRGPPVSSRKRSEKDVYDKLCEQIVNHIVTDDNATNTPRARRASRKRAQLQSPSALPAEALVEHAIASPIEAIDGLAFKPRNRLQQTPIASAQTPKSALKSALKQVDSRGAIHSPRRTTASVRFAPFPMVRSPSIASSLQSSTASVTTTLTPATSTSTYVGEDLKEEDSLFELLDQRLNLMSPFRGDEFDLGIKDGEANNSVKNEGEYSINSKKSMVIEEPSLLKSNTSLKAFEDMMERSEFGRGIMDEQMPEFGDESVNGFWD
ncbi:uncharacterized protein VTP21DRAFT_7100 [Calcarisporiella thermophila]|uniref:uncharacterized protein n=1 Tax=Calcarisporiella thermophila TaxID=911321 RepID=UPI003742A676